jgi:hypothetical protein
MLGRGLMLMLTFSLAAASSALADGGKSVPGRCLAVVGSKTITNEPCMIRLQPGGGFAFPTESSISSPPFSVAIDKGAGTATATWTRFDDVANELISTLGPLRRDGGCWIGNRVKLCAWSDEAQMLQNHSAPYTAFRTLLGKEVQGNCHMGVCEWFRFDRATPVAHNDHEVLLRIEGQSWDETSPEDTDPDYKKRHPKEDVDNGPSYYRCSHTRPAFLEDHGPKGWRSVPLSPDSDAGNYTADLQAYLMYAAACEGLNHPIVDPEGSRLGYETGGEEARQPLVPNLEDTLK